MNLNIEQRTVLNEHTKDGIIKCSICGLQLTIGEALKKWENENIFRSHINGYLCSNECQQVYLKVMGVIYTRYTN